MTRPAIAAALEEQGLTLLFAVPWPGQSLYSKAPINSTADVRGVSFRAYNAATERLAQLMGATPTQVEAGDIPTAFATGRVGAMITSPSTGVSSQAWDFVSEYTDTQAWLPKNMVVANANALAALPADQRAALLEAADAAETRGWDMSAAETAEKIATLKENGMNVVEPTGRLKVELLAIGETMTAEWLAEAGDAGKAVIDAYRAAK